MVFFNSFISVQPCVPSWVGGLLSTGLDLELVKGTGLELARQLWIFFILFFRVLWFIFHNITLSYKMWLVPHTNKQQEASSSTVVLVVWLETDVGKKLALTSFDATHSDMAEHCQSWFVLTTNFTLQRQRDCLNLLVKALN